LISQCLLRILGDREKGTYSVAQRWQRIVG
jgi:hypothetical protein